MAYWILGSLQERVAGLLCAGLASALMGIALPTATAQSLAPGVSPRVRISPNLPAAARGNPLQLPVAAAAAWPFPETFPRTSGTGRLNAGALYWTDFIYDDYGAVGLPAQKNPVLVRQPTGTFGYADPAAANNGADLFRAAVALRSGMTYWRVDFNTFSDPKLPIAMFAITDIASGESAAIAPWPAGAAVKGGSPSRFILISGTGAWLLDHASAVPVAQLGGAHHVDLNSRSFIVQIPQSALGASGKSRLRLVLGVANATKTGFRQLTAQEGRLDGQPNVYNVGFRSHEQEAWLSNNWRENVQAKQLTSGDVTPFYVDLDWSELQAQKTTPEAMPRGFSNRWYVSSVDLGPGYTNNFGSDIAPVFLGRVQPFGIYVPENYDATRPTPMTLIMHSGFSHHNQWAKANPANNTPELLNQLCRDRGALCVTTLNRSGYGWLYNASELDVFETWREVASINNIDADRVTVAGFSLGGWSSYKLGLSYPDLFAAVYVMAGPSQCAVIGTGWYDLSVEPSGTVQDPNAQCISPTIGGESSGDIRSLVENARWLPYYISHDVDDPLVPFTVGVEQAGRFRSAGYRFVFEQLPTRAHVGYGFTTNHTDAIHYLSRFKREPNPDRINLRWYPNHAYPGVGTNGAWWVQKLVAHKLSSSGLASIRAEVGSAPRPRPTVLTKTEVRSSTDPKVIEEQYWQDGAQPPAQATMNLLLENVASMHVDAVAAGLDATSGPVTVSLFTNAAAQVAFRVGRNIRLLQTGEKTTGQEEILNLYVPVGQHSFTFVQGGS